jgi:hypothetical protein
MLLKLVTAVVVAAAVTTGPAFACMGSTVIFADNFQTVDPAWTGTAFTVSGGRAQMAVQPQYSEWAWYEGSFVDAGDYCIDVIGPTLQDASTGDAGMIFGMTPSTGDFYAFMVAENGQAWIALQQNNAWLTPVSPRAAPALKQGPDVANTLRVTWKGNSASAYINGQPFVNFNLPQAFQNTLIGLMAENGTGAGIAYQFGNLKITNAP